MTATEIMDAEDTNARRQRSRAGIFFLLGMLLLAASARPSTATAANTLNWRTNDNVVTADIDGAELLPVLDQVALSTGWRIYLEPGVKQKVSAKFKDLSAGEGLRRLLGSLNFALVPGTNAAPRLYVFRTSQGNATQLVDPTRPVEKKPARPIPNELLVRVKPGTDIEALARALGAKVVGKLEGMNAYRLQFENAESTERARTQLASNTEVESVGSNFGIDTPQFARQVLSTSVLPPQLQLKPPPPSGRTIIGLIDTAVQPLGNNLDAFLLKPQSVAGPAILDPNVPSHGTSMAETILRSLESATGGRTSVQILPVDVYGSRTSTTTFDVAAGMVAAVNGGATILNLSLGSDGDNDFLRQLVAELNRRNIAIFAAKGNTPVSTAVFPAAYNEVTAVTSVERGEVASWANRAAIPAVGAPSSSVIYYRGLPWYNVGTSVSTAIVSGLAGGWLEANGGTAADAQTYIRNSLSLGTTGTGGR